MKKFADDPLRHPYTRQDSPAASYYPRDIVRVGLPDYRWRQARERSREDNLARARDDRELQTAGRPSCDVPPTATQLRSLVEACRWDDILYEFASVLAARRTHEGRLAGAQ